MILIVLFLISIVYTLSQSINFNVNWSDFLKKQDMVWSFKASDTKTYPTKWYDGPFAGNGNLGIMMYLEDFGGNTCLRINLGRADVWDHRMNDSIYAVHNNEYDRIRLDTGSYYLKTMGKLVDGTLRVNLYDATITGTINTSTGTIQFTAYVNSLHYIIIFDVVTSGDESHSEFVYVTRKTHLPRGERSDYKYNALAQCGNTGDIYHCQYILLAGGDYAEAHKRVDTSNGYKMYITMDNSVTFHIIRSKTALDGAIELINKYVNMDSNILFNEHTNWWHNYYNKSFLTIPHKKSESFYWIQLYKVASATRCQPDNCWAYDLIGPWYVDTYWSDYHFDLNIQIAAWPLWTSNHEELFESVVEFSKKNMQNFRLSVPPEFQNDCGAVPTETGWDWGIDGDSWGSTGGYVKPPGSILGNLNWLSQMLYTHYKYTNNITLLSDIVYPILKMSTQYYYRLLIKKDDGLYHIPNAMSPEYASCEDTNWDLSWYRWSVKTIEDIIYILKIDEPLLDKWLESINLLVKYPEDSKQGYIIGSNTKLTSMHRHWSHLFMIYPLHLIDYYNTPEYSDIIVKSIDHFLSFKPTDNAYSIAIASIFKQIIPDKEEESWSHFISSFDLYRIGKSTMYWEASDAPVNESPLALGHVLQYMMLRSDNGIVDVFPTHMNALKNSSFYNFKAEGGFLVSGVKVNGETQWISFTALTPSRLLFSCKDLLSIDHEPSDISIMPAKPGVYVVEFKQANRPVFIYKTGQKPAKYEINEVSGDGNINAWGKH